MTESGSRGSKLLENKPVVYEALTDEQFNEIIESGIAEYAAGQIVSAQSVRAQMSEAENKKVATE